MPTRVRGQATSPTWIMKVDANGAAVDESAKESLANPFWAGRTGRRSCPIIYEYELIYEIYESWFVMPIYRAVVLIDLWICNGGLILHE